MCSTAVNAKDRFAGAWPRMWHGRKTGHNRWRLVAWFNAAGRRVYIRGQSGAHLPARSFESNSRLVGTNIRQAGNQCRLEFVVAAIEQCIRCLLVETGQQADNSIGAGFEFVVRGSKVDHEVAEALAELNHGAGREYIQHELGGGACLEP